jgi:hypothetical protein
MITRSEKTRVDIGDYISEKWDRWTGLIISEDYRRSHQYLDRELYYSVLIVDKSGRNKVIDILASECRPIAKEVK